MAERNWSENIEYRSSGLRSPSTVTELQEIVSSSAKVKALGTRHSFNRVADTEGIQVSTASLDLAASVDTATMTATVPGGWTYAEVSTALQSQGVALRNLGSLPHISLAGGTATGTHGSGNTNQVLAAEIAAVELVTADGSLATFDRSMSEFGAIAVGLGAFGIITRVTLDVVPTYLARQDLYKDTTWDVVLENLEDIMASAYSVNLHADFSATNVRTIWQKARVETNPDGVPIVSHVPDVRWGATRLDAEELDAGRTTTLAPEGPWNLRLAHFTPESSPSVGGDELQSEYFVDRAHGANALDALRGMGDRIDPHLWGAEIRTVAADTLWLSPAAGRDCLTIGFTWKKHPEEVKALLPDIEATLDPYAPTPHWGKLFAFERDYLVDVFPRLDDALDLAASMDPTGKWMNSYLAKLAV